MICKVHFHGPPFPKYISMGSWIFSHRLTKTMYQPGLKTEAQVRAQLFSVKSDIKETYKHVTRLPLFSLNFCSGKYVLTVNMLSLLSLQKLTSFEFFSQF